MRHLKLFVIVDNLSETIISTILCESETVAISQFKDFVARYSKQLNDFTGVNLLSVFCDPVKREVPVGVSLPVKYSEISDDKKVCRLVVTGIEIKKGLDSSEE